MKQPNPLNAVPGNGRKSSYSIIMSGLEFVERAGKSDIVCSESVPIGYTMREAAHLQDKSEESQILQKNVRHNTQVKVSDNSQSRSLASLSYLWGKNCFVNNFTGMENLVSVPVIMAVTCSGLVLVFPQLKQSLRMSNYWVSINPTQSS